MMHNNISNIDEIIGDLEVYKGILEHAIEAKIATAEELFILEAINWVLEEKTTERLAGMWTVILVIQCLHVEHLTKHIKMVGANSPAIRMATDVYRRVKQQEAIVSLVDRDGKIIHEGDVITTFNGKEQWIFKAVTGPNKILCERALRETGMQGVAGEIQSREFFPSVFNLTLERERS